MMGHFSAKTGSDNRGYREIMGQHGLEEMNDNGERFANLCMCFEQLCYWRECLPPQKDTQGNFFLSPNLSAEKQIDHVCTGGKFRRSLQDVCVKHAIYVASDHHLLIAKRKLQLKRNWTGDSCQHPWFDTTMVLKDTTKR